MAEQRSGSNRQYSSHGLTAIKSAVKIKGLSVIDKRTIAARELINWRKSVMADLGGEHNLSMAQKTLVETATRLKLFLDHIDAFLMCQKTLVNRNGVLPALLERQRIAEQ